MDPVPFVNRRRLRAQGRWNSLIRNIFELWPPRWYIYTWHINSYGIKDLNISHGENPVYHKRRETGSFHQTTGWFSGIILIVLHAGNKRNVFISVETMSKHENQLWESKLPKYLGHEGRKKQYRFGRGGQNTSLNTLKAQGEGFLPPMQPRWYVEEGQECRRQVEDWEVRGAHLLWKLGLKRGFDLREQERRHAPED